MEQLKHECGIALVRLRKPLEYYREKYGSETYALDRLYLLMEKQHNRGQEAAGVGVVDLNAEPGHEYIFRQRELGTGAIDSIFANIGKEITAARVKGVKSLPFVGQIYMGHLRYSTTGRAGMEYTHPFLRRNNWRSRTLMLCGNFNMTNADDIFAAVVASGQHPRLNCDTSLILEQLGNALDKENHRLYRQYRDTLRDPELAHRIEAEIDLTNMLLPVAPNLDGGYAMCGVTGSGSAFVLRDPNGIRPAFYYVDDEVVVVASERPVIQTVFNVAINDVREIEPGTALFISPSAEVETRRILAKGANKACSFERIYFSRGSDRDIYRERKQLGANIVDDLLKMLGGDLDNTVFSFIPNTAEVAYNGMVEELNRRMDIQRKDEILALSAQGKVDRGNIERILARKVRTEKLAIKDIKLRTFIAEGSSRNDLAAHVYDVTYGCIRTGEDTMVVIDDSIVRGTTLTRSILRILDRLKPRRIIVVSSSPQVRYPDYYGIDLANLQELAAFRALIDMLLRDGRRADIDRAFEKAVANLEKPAEEEVNAVKDLYALYSYEEISQHIAQMLTPAGIDAKVDILFQTVEGLHQAVPSSPGDWYFSGDYPTPGGTRNVTRGFRDYYLQTFLPSGTEI
ncbi:MAG: amidophosphoribosyltransferase [Muribaculaceae bacterium]